MADNNSELRERWNPETVCREATLLGWHEDRVRTLEHMCDAIYTGSDEVLELLDERGVQPLDILDE